MISESPYNAKDLESFFFIPVDVATGKAEITVLGEDPRGNLHIWAFLCAIFYDTFLGFCPGFIGILSKIAPDLWIPSFGFGFLS